MWLNLVNKKRRGESIRVGGWPCCRLSPLLASNSWLFLLLNDPPANLNYKWEMNTLEATEGEQTQRRKWEEGTRKEEDPNRNKFLHFTNVNDQSHIISLVLGATSKELCHEVKMCRKNNQRPSSMASLVLKRQKQHYSLFWSPIFFCTRGIKAVSQPLPTGRSICQISGDQFMNIHREIKSGEAS